MNPLWIVTSRDGPDLACETRGQAMEHCAIMAGDFPQCAPWNVTEYVPASDLAAAKADAERYRLMRDSCYNFEMTKRGIKLETRHGVKQNKETCLDFDAAIDSIFVSLPQKPAQDA